MITISNNNDLIVQSTPKLTYSGMIKLFKNGEVIGSLDGTFDFSNLPNDLHMTAADLILSRGASIHLPSGIPARYNARSALLREDRNPWWKNPWVRRIFY